MGKGRATLAKFCTILGWILIILAFGAILVGTLSTLFFEGFEGYWEVVRPYNIYNIIMIVIVLSPGVGFVALGNKIRDKDGN
jgi:cytochrome c biogenesis factor